MNNGFIDAKCRFEKAIHESKLENEELGIYLQRLARIAYLTDPAEALKIQQGARDRCHAVCLPPAAPRRPAMPGGKTAAEKICAWFKGFASPNAAVIEAKRIADSLDLDSDHRTVEAAIMRLGEALGADSSRPEMDYNEGPDNLWFWGGNAIVIEVKSNNEKTLHKSDSGQLHDSLEWARKSFPEFAERLIPLTVAKVYRRDKDAHYPEGSRVLTAEGCASLCKALHQLCQKLAAQGPIFVTPENVMTEMASFGLLPQQLLGRHTRRIE